MKTLRGAGALVAIATLGCVLGCDPYPVAEVTLVTSNGTTRKTVGSNNTFGWGVSELQPATDGNGISLTFSRASNDSSDLGRNQQVVLLEWPWHTDPGGARADGYPIQLNFLGYNARRGYGSMNLAAPPGVPQSSIRPIHMIRYWHGQCRLAIPWASPDFSDSLFYQVESGFSEGVACGVQYEEQPPFDDTGRRLSRLEGILSPVMTVDATFEEVGFTHFARYRIDAEFGVDVSIRMEPTYKIELDEASGLPVFSNLSRNVVVVPSEPSPVPGDKTIKQRVEEGIVEDLPSDLGSAVKDSITFVISELADDPLVAAAASCTTASEPLEAQQAQCFETLVGDDPAESVLQFGFEQLIPFGGDVAEIATRMTRALTPRNFACVDTPATGQQCAVRPVVERLNVTPEHLVLVLSGEPELGERQQDLQLLYTLLPVIAANADDFDLPAPFVDLCGPYQSASRVGTVAQHRVAGRSYDIDRADCE